MTKSTVNIIMAAAAILILLLAFLYGRSSVKPAVETKTVIKRDTVIIIKPAEPIVIERAKARVVYVPVGDTVITTQPFVASLDTIVRTDTIYARYQFPSHTFDVIVKPHPDSLRIERELRIETKEIERPWYKRALDVIAGVFIGFIAGSVLK